VKKIIAILFCALILFFVAGCDEEDVLIEENIYVFDGEVFEWITYENFIGENFWENEVQLELSHFPNVIFTWNSRDGVWANGEEFLFNAMPLWNVFIADINGDGFPSFAATGSMGSGIVNHFIIVYDFANNVQYGLNDRMNYNYRLSFENGNLIATQTPAWGEEIILEGSLAIIDGELIIVPD
jgi:hypothetical protein